MSFEERGTRYFSLPAPGSLCVKMSICLGKGGKGHDLHYFPSISILEGS